MTEGMIKQKNDSATQGREIWLSLAKECVFDEDTFVILFPRADTMCNKYVMKYLSDFADMVKTRRIVLLSFDRNVLNAVSDTNIGVTVFTHFVSREDAVKIMDYYMLQMFTDRLIIASLDEPEGRSGSNIIGIKGITEEEAVAVGVLGLAGI